MRNENTMTILRYIQENGPVVRKDLKEGTGLSWGSVSSIVNSLIERGLIAEQQANGGDRGRIPGELDIATGKHFVLGLDINRSGITVVVLNLKYHLINSSYEKIEEPAYEAVMRQSYALLDNAKQKAEAEGRSLIGIGAAMQGSVDAANGVSRFTPYFDNWHDVPLRDMLTERYRCGVIVEHTPECAATYETWCGAARGSKDFLYIRLGHSIGVSIMIDGKILRGFNGNAGEFGHTIVVPDGEACHCGGKGCLETVASEGSLIKHILEDIRAGEASILPDLLSGQPLESLTMDTVYRAYCLGDTLCHQHIDRVVYYLAIAIANLINLLNPELIVLGGDMVRYDGMFIEKLRQEIERRAWGASSKTIITSTNENNTAALGASLLIFQHLFSDKSDYPFLQWLHSNP